MIDHRPSVRTWLPILLLLAAFVPWGGPLAGADEGEEAGHLALDMRIYHVSALTGGKYEFLGEVAPPTSASDRKDEESPLFGAETEEPLYPVGQADELIELIKGGVHPWFWEETEGADMRTMGEGALVVRASKKVHEAIARFLAGLEDQVLRTVRVELQAVRLDERAAARARTEGIEALLTGPDVGPSLAFIAFTDQRVSAFDGREYAYVQDYDVEVAQEATISDAIVSVANLGLGVDARVTPSDGGRRLLVELDIHLSELAETRSVPTGEHRGVEAPTFDGTYVDSLVRAVPGRWTRAGGSKAPGWTFYVRVTPIPATFAPATAAPLPPLEPSGGKYELRHIETMDLCRAPRPRRSWPRHIVPTRWTPPEPPELPDPRPFVAASAQVEFIRDVGGGMHWEDPCTIEIRNGRVIMRNFPRVLDHAERVVESLRREFIRPIRIVGEVVDVPADVARALTRPGTDVRVVGADAARLLEQALKDGTARTLERVELVCHDGVHNAVSSGRNVVYLHDYEVEIAQGATNSNPVMFAFFSGIQLDVTAYRLTGDKAVGLDVRLMRTQQRGPMRRADTPSGPIELPEMDVFRIRTGVAAPLGGRVVVGSQGNGERRQVLMLTPSVRAR